MIFRQFYLESLGHASYLVGSETTGEALVLDVRRDVEIYFQAARAQGLRIAYAADTHQHNDYLTGICELPARGEVKLLAGARAELGYPVRALADGERLEMGEVTFQALHTPGHTPEHTSLLVYDRSRGEEPVILLSGGSLLVGDLARPDLLGGPERTREAASELVRSMREKVLPLPDSVMVFPTHVSGSLCGGNIGSMLHTTIGYERRMNRLLAAIEQGDPDPLDLQDLPTVPPYWRRMRSRNQAGPELLGVLREPPALRPAGAARLLKEGAIALDCRQPEAFGGGHVAGALNVALGSSFSTWAGTVLPAGARVVLVLDRPSDLWEACWQLLRIGYDLPLGWLSGGMLRWRTEARPLAFLTQWTVHDLRERLLSERGLRVLDVRQPGEWRAGHIAGALHIPGGELPGRLAELPRQATLAVICGSGFRSSVAASLIARLDRGPVVNVLGGMSAWKEASFPLET
ncbi:MAG TPA: MBL fold metallo-hydrolase [Candidatus Polarisedimenticolia bacterium]|nr:MBL fold metallo-hydrolase [Candidatus Polarisedimenticolia bacterium]